MSDQSDSRVRALYGYCAVMALAITLTALVVME